MRPWVRLGERMTVTTTAVESAAESEAATAPLRIVTAASLFDGHDAAINVMRRLIQAAGAEVIHLGHNRSVADVVRAAVQEDADAIAISSYQGGHVEYFRYAIDMLREAGASHIRVFGGGGGTITADEATDLEAYGVERLYSPADGLQLGLTGMIDDLVARSRAAQRATLVPDVAAPGDDLAVAQMLSALEDGAIASADLGRLETKWAERRGGRARCRNHGHGWGGQEHRDGRDSGPLSHALPVASGCRRGRRSDTP